MTRLIVPITPTARLRGLCGVGASCAGARVGCVLVIAALSSCSPLPVLPPEQPVDPMLTQRAAVEAHATAAVVGRSARAVLPLTVVLRVTEDVNTLIAAMEAWYDALEATYPTSRELDAEALPSLHASRTEATQVIARLGREPTWAYRPLHELMARTLDLSDALVRYQIDRAALSRLPSDRYAQLASVHNAWREALLTLQRELRSGRLRAAFTPGSLADSSPSRAVVPAPSPPVPGTDASEEGATAVPRPQSILPDEL